MQIKCEVHRVTSTKGDGGLDVGISLKFIADNNNTLGMLFELMELQSQQVIVTMEGLQGRLELGEKRPIKED